MKKQLIYFSFLLLSPSFSFAQDTLVLRDGKKMAVQVTFVGYKIFYCIPPSDQKMAIGFSKVEYIKYKDGYIYSINTRKLNENDTIPLVKLEPYLLVAAGTSNPWTFSGYGADSYYNGYDGYGYSGYALDGSDFSFTGGVNIIRGWGVIGMFSYIRNQFDASGIMNETVNNFFINDNDIISINNVDAIGNYYYTNYSLLLGINKDWLWHKRVGFGLGLLFGKFITHTPALHGTATGFAMDGNNITQTPATDYFNMNSEVQTNSVTEMNFHINAFITHHIFIRAMLEFQLTGLANSGGYQIVDIPSGNTLYSGSYMGSSYRYSGFFVGLTDVTLGVGYRF
jgi:hypothetical protein